MTSLYHNSVERHLGSSGIQYGPQHPQSRSRAPAQFLPPSLQSNASFSLPTTSSHIPAPSASVPTPVLKCAHWF
ncbi:uncharacterized protein EI90DRAFT_3132801 [Cantharellus anzutake]|uniref:uncharacterized protein n=1 Tax=Cantharellus anzutake TaxID=1750568 RepID=UPI0019069B0F|nr:uncharacterized protein EI90DRAFT_3132801 [Cantharellus anzutake]KAF8319148.1 hypothetical protein EI90DRAFT_3132801 [Cantharellus anzutake]